MLVYDLATDAGERLNKIAGAWRGEDRMKELAEATHYAGIYGFWMGGEQKLGPNLTVPSGGAQLMAASFVHCLI